MYNYSCLTDYPTLLLLYPTELVIMPLQYLCWKVKFTEDTVLKKQNQKLNYLLI